MSRANDGQVGGAHYKSEFQHWDFIEMHGIGYLEAAATKYVVRHRQKSGREDLMKALHYTNKLIELHEHVHRPPRGIAATEMVLAFCQDNNLNQLEATVVGILSRWSCTNDLRMARVAIEQLLAQTPEEQSPVVTAAITPKPESIQGLASESSAQTLFAQINALCLGFDFEILSSVLAQTIADQMSQEAAGDPNVMQRLSFELNSMIAHYLYHVGPPQEENQDESGD